jgi:hypothetical protein
VVYVSYIVAIYWHDIKMMNNQMNYDFTILKDHRFFKENKDELSHFKQIHSDLKNRVNKLKTSLRLINALVWLLNIGLIVYGLNIINPYTKIQVLIMTLIGLTIWSITTQYFIFNDQDSSL